MESFTLFIDVLTKVFQKVSTIAMQKMLFDAHVSINSFVALQKFLENFGAIPFQ